ncbi:MAG: hypothetical protein K940chlam8_00457 [Chlamydiae bacterium]|nr:hypothetical protein [Chlamydiota bacterium]
MHIPGSTMAYNAITHFPKLTMAASAATLIFLAVSRLFGNMNKPKDAGILDFGAALTNLDGVNPHNIGSGIAITLSIAGLYLNIKK